MLTLQIKEKEIENLTPEEEFVRGTVGAKCQINFDEFWQSYNKYIVFKRVGYEPINFMVDTLENEIEIPYTILAESGEFKIGVFGITETETLPTLYSKDIKILYGTDTHGTTPPTYIPSEIDQLRLSKQDKLVSGENIKTINNQSILGSGNITIEGGSDVEVDQNYLPTSENAQSGKAVNEAVSTKADKTEVNKLKDDLVELDEYVLDPTTYTVRSLGTFASGGLSNIAFDPNQFYRCSSVSLIHAENDIKLHADNGYRFGWSESDSEGTFLQWHGWFTNEAIIKKGTYFRLQIAKVNESQSITSNVHEFTNAIQFDTVINTIESDIAFIKNKSTENNKGIDYLNSCGKFIRGSLHYGQYQVRDYRVCSDNIINFGRSVTLTIKDGFRIVTEIWENGAWKSSVDWRSGTVHLDNLDYKFVIARITENYTEIADILEFTSAIKLETEIGDRITALENSVRVTNYVKTPWIQEIHRGITSQTIYENTVASMLEASKQGFNQVECDIRMTSDNVLVMAHEESIGGYVIADTTYDTLKSITLATDSVYGEQHIATFEEILKVAYYKELILNVDIKVPSIIDAVVDAVLKSGMSGKVIYSPNSGETSDGLHILSLDKRAKILYPYNKANIEEYYATAFEDKSKIIIWQYFYNVNEESLNVIRNSGFALLIADVLNSTYFDFRPDIIEYRTAPANEIHRINKEYMDALTF